MAKKKKVYEITIQIRYIGMIREEFKHWGVRPSSYTLYGNILYTRDTNVVDVITETLNQSAYTIHLVNMSPSEIAS